MQVLLLVMLGCAKEPPVEEPAAIPEATSKETPADPPAELSSFVGQPVALRIRDLRLDLDGAEVLVQSLVGRLEPRGEMVDLEDPTTFTVEIEALELRIPEQSIAGALKGPDGASTPVKDVSVRTEGDAFVVEGSVRPLALPFVFRADPVVTDDGKLALDLEKVKLLGIGLRGFLSTFERPVENTVNRGPRRGLLNVEEDRLIVDPFPYAGPPEVHARFTSFEVDETGLVARLGESPDAEGWPHGLTLAGGALRTGNTVLFGSTVSLVALDDEERLTLDPARLDDQISNGFSKLKGETVTLYLAPPGGAEVKLPTGSPP